MTSAEIIGIVFRFLFYTSPFIITFVCVASGDDLFSNILIFVFLIVVVLFLSLVDKYNQQSQCQTQQQVQDQDTIILYDKDGQAYIVDQEGVIK